MFQFTKQNQTTHTSDDGIWYKCVSGASFSLLFQICFNMKKFEHAPTEIGKLKYL